MLRRLIAALKDAASPTEDGSERGGLLSYAVEWHALAIGAAVGFAAVTTGQYQLAAGVIAVAFGLNRARTRVTEEVAFQIRREPWYFVGGLALGGALAVLVGVGTLPV